ncbi:MAG: hypothetical protein FH758_01590 [Firmicutes bacterium]|nr:hypothetical protein [Bacillota bacterium]
MDNQDVIAFTNEVRQFVQIASQNGKIPSDKVDSIIEKLESTKQDALAEGINVDPINGLIAELKES